MKRWMLTLGLSLVVAVGATSAAMAQAAGEEVNGKPADNHLVPEPSIVPQSWQLELHYQQPMRLVKRLPGQKQDTYYWYILYTVTNRGDEDIYYLPRITMLTDELELVDAQMSIPPSLFKQIKELHKAKYLEEPLRVTDRVVGGADNARDSVALFALKEDPKWFRVFFCGLSGEQRQVKVPVADGGSKSVAMEKCRMLEYRVPGNTRKQDVPPVIKVLDKWVMRSAAPRTQLDVDLSAAAKGNLDKAVRPADQIEKSAPAAEPKEPGNPAPQTAPAPAEQPAEPAPAPAEQPAEPEIVIEK